MPWPLLSCSHAAVHHPAAHQPSPQPFVHTLLSLFPPSHVCTIGALHLAGSRYLNPSAWSTLPPPLPLGFETTSSREPALIHPLKANSPGLSLNLTYPFLSLHISYFCTCHLKFWLLRGGKFAREIGGKNCLVSKTREETC